MKIGDRIISVDALDVDSLLSVGSGKIEGISVRAKAYHIVVRDFTSLHLMPICTIFSLLMLQHVTCVNISLPKDEVALYKWPQIACVCFFGLW